jgi:hypothetical protein
MFQHLAQTGRKSLYALCRLTALSIQMKGHANDDPADLFFLHHAGDFLLGFLFGIECLQRTGDEFHLIADGEADTDGAVVDGENAWHEVERVAVS